MRQERRAAATYAAAAYLGPTPVDEAIGRCESALEQTAGDRQSEGILLTVLAGLYGMQGEFDHARLLAARGRSLFDDLGLGMEKARLGMEAASIERFAGDLDAAVQELTWAYEALDAVGEKYVLSTVAGFLAQALLEQGLLDEATSYWERSRALATEGDVETQALWRCLKGRTLARRGSFDEAEVAVREALALLEPTDATMMRLNAQAALGEVLEAAGRHGDARLAYETARTLAEDKGGVVILSDVLRRLADLDAASRAT